MPDFPTENAKEKRKEQPVTDESRDKKKAETSLDDVPVVGQGK